MISAYVFIKNMAANFFFPTDMTSSQVPAYEKQQWADITPFNVSFDNFEQNIGQKLPRIIGV